MAIKSTEEIYSVLERTLADASEPMTCHELMNVPEVRACAVQRFSDDIQETTNKLSNTLGLMWRRGILERYSVSKPNTRASFGYKVREAAHLPKIVPSKDKFEIREEHGSIVIEFSQFVLTVRPK